MIVVYMLWYDFIWFYTSYDHAFLINCSENENLKIWSMLAVYIDAHCKVSQFWKKIFIDLIEVSKCVKVIYMNMFNVGEGSSSIKEG